MIRYDDWADRLNNEINSWREKEYSLGSYDCCQFAIECEKAMYGTTRFTEFEPNPNPKYTTDEEIIELCNAEGCKNWTQLLDKRLETIHRNYVQRGDVMAINHNSHVGLAINLGLNFANFGGNGLVFGIVSDAQVIRAWQV
jgi:hypothetical protein